MMELDGEKSMNNSEEAVTLVVGLGEVGKPLFTILKKHEPDTIGIDIEPAPVDKPVGDYAHLLSVYQFGSVSEGGDWLCAEVCSEG